MKKIIVSLLATLLVPFSEVVATSSAEVLYASSPDNIEVSAPLDDLRGDEAFRRDYGNGLYNVGVATGYQVVDLGEYKYGTSGYALYLYVWNCEQDANFLYESPRNRVEIYNQKNEEYVHLNVKFIQKSFNQFYKYKIEFDESTVSFVKDNDDERKYVVAGFEAYETGSANAVDYSVGKIFKYRGYYYDETLECDASDIETLHLEVHGGTYRTASSSDSQTARNDLYYVWFGIDKNLFNKYGNLYAIHCDYYKFDLSNKIAALLSSEYDPNAAFRIKIYPDYCGYYYGGGTYRDNNTWISLTSNGMESSGNNTPANYFDGSTIYIDNLNTKITGNYLNSKYSMNQVCSMAGVNFDDIALNESAGYYKNINITADSTYDLLSYGSTHNGWDNFWARLRGVNTSELSISDIPAIERFQNSSSINDCTVLDSSDKTEMMTYKSSNSSKDVVCLRFATGVYDSENIYYSEGTFMPVPYYYTMNESVRRLAGFKAKQGLYAFMDFDIIDVTFMSEMGEKTVLPVVASPINVWSSLENTTLEVTGLNWPKIIRLILIILGIFILLLVGLWLLPKTLKLDTSKSNKKRRK